ncbi:MAG: RNA-binding transcriptional accessory protein [Ignavibacteria bacterium]|nr:RNA-binding transcriptional accessory protein [Ignavibacteria bacterium]
MQIPSLIADELKIRKEQVDSVLTMLAEGSTIPFIVRYRKERTGGLEEDQLREIEERNNYLTLLGERRETILKSIAEQGKLTDELQQKIEGCTRLQELEDLYLPYKPKRKTRGTVAKAKGLEPLALFLLENLDFDGDIMAKAAEFINDELGVGSAIEALQGAKDILAEMVSDNADVRKTVRENLQRESVVRSVKREDVSLKDETNEKLKDKDKKDVYRIYFDFQIDITKLKPYQILALNRGEAEKFLKIELEHDQLMMYAAMNNIFLGNKTTPLQPVFDEVFEDSYKRLIFPSVEKEVRNTLTEIADQHAIEIFASNLRQLLLQSPLSDKMIMGIDPGYVSGCKVAVIDKTGKYLEGATIYPHPPKNRETESKEIIHHFIKKYGVEVVSIGNGTASRETEQLVADLLKEKKLSTKYIIVSEAGASVYSASEVAKKEFPELEASQRGNISIARRLLDPLAELVKIDPKSIGVGLYQHDVDQKLLAKKLDDVVVSCVNYVGVDVNTASESLLAYVSGLNKKLAGSIVKHREKNGRFTNRQQILEVAGIGAKTFEQAAGFLKIANGDNPLDNTFIHPESYVATETLLKMFNFQPNQFRESIGLIDFFMEKKGVKKIAQEVGLGEPTLNDIIENLKKPGRDPREDVPPPILRSDVLKMEDLREGMRLKGTVRNIVDFGAFVDIGVKQDGLIHISQLANKFVKNPLDVLKVGDIIDVTILQIDIERKRIALSMK